MINSYNNFGDSYPAPRAVLASYQGNPLTSIVSSVTETDLFGGAGTGFLLPADTLDSQKRIRIHILAEILNNTGTNHGATFKAYYGSSSVTSSAIITVSSANWRHIIIDHYVVALGVTGTQYSSGLITYESSGSSPASLPAGGTSNSTISVNSTLDQAVRITSVLSANNANLHLNCFSATIELIG